MRYLQNDKYTIAWFKLAECVAKGEKEKAFGVYRLLMHSLDDQAYAHQLEGDLLGAFQDERAIEKYAHAAHLYHQNNRYKEAAALYEELLFLMPHDDRHLIRVVEVYKKYKTPERFTQQLLKLSDTMLQKNMYRHAMIIAGELEGNADAEIVAQSYTKMVVSVITNDQLPELIDIALQQAIKFLLQLDTKNQLQSFLGILKQTNDEWYVKAQEYL